MDADEAAHNEQLHQDLHCLQIQLFSSLVLKVMMPQSNKHLFYVFYRYYHDIFFCISVT